MFPDKSLSIILRANNEFPQTEFSKFIRYRPTLGNSRPFNSARLREFGMVGYLIFSHIGHLDFYISPPSKEGVLRMIFLNFEFLFLDLTSIRMAGATLCLDIGSSQYTPVGVKQGYFSFLISVILSDAYCLF